MLRDIPKIYMTIVGFVLIMLLLVFWYKENFQRNSDVLQLNEIILTSAVNEIDQASRAYNFQDGSVLMLNDTFESSVWERLEHVYPKDSEVMFVYTFDANDDRFSNVSSGTESDIYKLGSNNKPKPNESQYMIGKPILTVEVKVKDATDDVAGWTYVSSVTVDRMNEYNRN